MEEVREFYNRGTEQEDINCRHQAEYGREQQFECGLVGFLIRPLLQTFTHVITVFLEGRSHIRSHLIGLDQEGRKRVDFRYIDTLAEVRQPPVRKVPIEACSITIFSS